jgi:pimeloyl-ACP methyl ester carboxylesterase
MIDMMKRLLPAGAAIALVLILTQGCTDPERDLGIGSVAEGAECLGTSQCEPGFACEGEVGTKVCVGLPDLEVSLQGSACSSDSECGEFSCGRQGVCTDAVPKGAGEACGLSIDCAEGLVCNGFCGTCTNVSGSEGGCANSVLTGFFDGVADFGEECLTPLSCRRPYICGVDKTCQKLPSFSAANCEASYAEQGDFRVYFETPPDSIFISDPDLGENFEFYRLPFPNDMRVNDGEISLTGHFEPGEVLGMSIREDYFEVVEQEAGGFAPNTPVFFRLSDYVMEGTVCLPARSAYPECLEPIGSGTIDLSGVLGEEEGDAGAEDTASTGFTPRATACDPAPSFCDEGAEPSVVLVNVDTESATYGEIIPVQLSMERTAGAYICHNSLAIGPLDGEPLDHGTTFAAYITTAVRDIRGEAPVQDVDFQAIMEGKVSAPEMDPFLNYLDEQGIDRASIAGATVFTTSDPDEKANLIRDAVYQESGGFNGDAVVCDTQVISPCDDNLTGLFHTRGCSPANGNFHEVHGTYESPIYQAGFNRDPDLDGRPYKQSSDGGNFVYGSDGMPIVQGYESMCYSLTVPKGQAEPAGGWPVVVYAHGTGGSFVSQMGDSTADRLTELGYAVIGIDNISHGPRSGLPAQEALFDGGQSFFNLANPRASRDNILQGSADLFYLVKMLRGNSLSVAGQTVNFNPERVSFFGHSQGTVVAPAFLSVETEIEAAILSGVGSELALSILYKKAPIDVSQIAAQFFGDQGIARLHPVLGIFASLYARSDSISYAPSMLLGGGGVPAYHLFMTSGLSDSYTPDITHAAFMRSSGIPLVGEVSQAVPGVPVVDNNQSGNIGGKTVGALQFPTGGGASDGHFVIFSD